MFSRVIHDVAYIIISHFLWLKNSTVWICHISFAFSSVHEHLDCFHFLAILNAAAMNIHVQAIKWTYVLIFFVETELLGHIITLVLTLWGYEMLFSKVAASFHNLTIIKVHSSYSKNSPVLDFFILSILVGGKWYLIWYWNTFPWWLISIFLHALQPSVTSLRKCLFKSITSFYLRFYPFIVGCVSSLCLLDINLVSYIWLNLPIHFSLF